MLGVISFPNEKWQGCVRITIDVLTHTSIRPIHEWDADNVSYIQRANGTAEGLRAHVMKETRERESPDGWGKKKYKWPRTPLKALHVVPDRQGTFGQLALLHWEERCRTCGQDIEETGNHIVFDCPTHHEQREKAGQPRKWEGLDKERMIEEEGGKKHDAVLDLFWSIGVRLERERGGQGRE